MEVEPYFAPPDPSGEVFLPPVPLESPEEVTLPIMPAAPEHPSTKARAAMGVAVALVAVAALFFVGRWTTGGERNALADERDAALAERDQLKNDLADATTTNITNETTIDELESAAARDAAELTSLQADVATLTEQSESLQQSNDELWRQVDAVTECGNSVDLAETALDEWDAMIDVLDEYLQTEPGSDAERDAQQRLDRAWADIDTAESNFVASSSRCTEAIDALPACGTDVAQLRLATELQDAACP
jgi:chromosome segregation ATPase